MASDARRRSTVGELGARTPDPGQPVLSRRGCRRREEAEDGGTDAALQGQREGPVGTDARALQAQAQEVEAAGGIGTEVHRDPVARPRQERRARGAEALEDGDERRRQVVRSGDAQLPVLAVQDRASVHARERAAGFHGQAEPLGDLVRQPDRGARDRHLVVTVDLGGDPAPRGEQRLVDQARQAGGWRRILLDLRGTRRQEGRNVCAPRARRASALNGLVWRVELHEAPT
jgi:hypothetical protein